MLIQVEYLDQGLELPVRKAAVAVTWRHCVSCLVLAVLHGWASFKTIALCTLQVSRSWAWSRTRVTGTLETCGKITALGLPLAGATTQVSHRDGQHGEGFTKGTVRTLCPSHGGGPAKAQVATWLLNSPVDST